MFSFLEVLCLDYMRYIERDMWTEEVRNLQRGKKTLLQLEIKFLARKEIKNSEKHCLDRHFDYSLSKSTLEQF